MNRAELVAAYGHPLLTHPARVLRALGVTDLPATQACAFIYPSREAAQAFQAYTTHHHGLPALGVTELGGQVVGAYDLRPALERLRR